MDAIAERPQAAPASAGATCEPPRAAAALRWHASPPADAARIARWIDASALPPASGASIVVVDALTKLSAPALEALRAFLDRHPGASAVVVDRMDDAGCEYVVFDALRARLVAAGLVADRFVPAISATGEGIASGADRIDWYRGPTLREWLASLSPQPAVRCGGGTS